LKAKTLAKTSTDIHFEMMSSSGTLAFMSRRIIQCRTSCQRLMSSQVTGPETSKTSGSEVADASNTDLLKSLANDSPVQSRITRFALYKYSKRGYKSMEDVPNFVPKSEMDNSRSKLRIVINLGMIVLGLFSAIGIIINEKRHRAAGGISWVEKNMLKHESYKRDYEEEQAAKAKAKEGL